MRNHSIASVTKSSDACRAPAPLAALRYARVFGCVASSGCVNQTDWFTHPDDASYMSQIHSDCKTMVSEIIEANMPGILVKQAMHGHAFAKRVCIVAIGKAAWTMTQAAVDFLGSRLAEGIVITKYGHSKGCLPHTRIFEAGHPICDENGILATAECIALAEEMQPEDELLFLISGGGSALFEKPLQGVTMGDLQMLTSKMLASGADIVEVNMVRKRLSAVKGGRFAELVAPSRIFSIILSDVLGDRLDSIASGPAAADISTAADAMRAAKKYSLELSAAQRRHLQRETPKQVTNVKSVIVGSVRTLCESAATSAAHLGYKPYILTSGLNCEASEAGRMLSAIAAGTQLGHTYFKPPCAIIAGGETVVTLHGSGMGGRNQELALSAAKGIEGLPNTLIFSLGSDGTDGPTDAAGGVVCGRTMQRLRDAGVQYEDVLSENDSYNALRTIDGLIITGPTGTNVNDVAVVLCGK